MKRRAVLLVALALAAAPLAIAGGRRAPAVAGTFYPADPGTLAVLIDSFLGLSPAGGPTPVMIVTPHAGYEFSGRVAGKAYSLLRGRAFETVILLGPSHKVSIERGAAVWESGEWQTPLGTVAVDERTAAAILAADPSFAPSNAPHEREHSLEVQLPFLQHALAGSFRIVPIAVNDFSEKNTKKLASAISKAIGGKDALVVVSTDMTHYLSLETAVDRDRDTMKTLISGDADVLAERIRSRQGELCGAAAVVTGLRLASERGWTGRMILYDTSVSAGGSPEFVVGYGALAFAPAPVAAPVRPAVAGALSEADRAALLLLARRTLESFAATGRASEPTAAERAIAPVRGVFVTLRDASGALRGCIGTLDATNPLYLEVRDRTIEAASRDPRFSPVTAAEAGKLSIEISVLSRPELATASAIEPGRHGVVIERKGKRGVFLPQVWRETGWDKERFLSELCSQKAGLPADAWKDPRTMLWTFTADSFEEPVAARSAR